MGKKIIFIVNSIIAFLTILLFVLMVIPPSKQAILCGATILSPLGIVANIVFFVYWLLQLDKRAVLSMLILTLGYSQVNRFFSFSSTKESPVKKTIKLASFNSLHFRGENFKPTSINQCFHLFNTKGVDIVGLQESNIRKKNKDYTYNNFKEGVFTQSWMYTKHPIKSSGVLLAAPIKNKRQDFTYVDVVVNQQMLRVYNVHFFSYQLPKHANQLKKSGITKLVAKISNTFKVHEKELQQLITHIKTSPYPVVVMGDFNNNAYSYEYTQLLKQCHLKDTFTEAGNGFGATFDFKYFPTRIDFILVPKTATVHTHEVLKIKRWSDHYPIIAEISM